MNQRELCSFALVVSLAFVAIASQASARGGHSHGLHGFGELGRHGEMAPAYVIINVAKIQDEQLFKAATDQLNSAIATFSCRIIADVDKPVSWYGEAPVHLLMIEFNTPDQAQAWKASEAFKNFDAALHRGAEAQIELVQGLLVPAGGVMARSRHGRFAIDQQAFEPIVKEYDQTLSKIHGICRGC